MPPFNQLVRRFQEEAAGVWNGMSVRRRWAIGGALGAALVVLVAFSAQFGQEPYAPLFTRLLPADAGEIVAALRESGVPYRLAEDGSTILVPQEQVYETRLDLANTGLPRGGVVGFESFGSLQLGLTDFERHVKYNVALQGELTRTIRELEPVRDARVHIVIPERSLFVQSERQPTASVLVELKPGMVLSPSQVRGIAHLVAKSVEGLQPENVTIVDTRGNVLSDAIATQDPLADGQALQRRLMVERLYENDLERSIQTMLEQVYGTGKVVARVKATMNFDLTEQKEESFAAPNGRAGLPRSEQRKDEAYQGNASPPAGVPGVTSNTPGVPGYPALNDQNSEYTRSESLVNYELNRTEVARQIPPGRIDRLTVAVWIDGDLDPAARQQVQDSVASAAGIDQARGDSISIESIRFGAAEPQAPAVTRPTVPWWALAAALLLLLAAVSVWIRLRRAPEQAPAAAALDLLIGDESEFPEEEAVPERELTPEERQRLLARERLAELARHDPQAFAQLLRTWLIEE